MKWLDCWYEGPGPATVTMLVARAGNDPELAAQVRALDGRLYASERSAVSDWSGQRFVSAVGRARRRHASASREESARALADLNPQSPRGVVR